MPYDYDYTFCERFTCKKHDCRRHQINMPSDQYGLYRADFCPNGLYEECLYYSNKNNEALEI